MSVDQKGLLLSSDVLFDHCNVVKCCSTKCFFCLVNTSTQYTTLVRSHVVVHESASMHDCEFRLRYHYLHFIVPHRPSVRFTVARI
jgi:hypothetical protein